MKFEELFSTNTEEEKPLKMSITDFVNKTRMILAKIDKEMGTAHRWRRVTDDEYEQQDCDNCKGECTILKDGIELHCKPNKEEGECFVLEFQYETFLDEIENVVYNDDKYEFYELLSCEIEQQQVITGNELYKELENWFEERHGIATIGEYTEMQEISFGGRFEEIREFLNHIGLNCEEA